MPDPSPQSNMRSAVAAWIRALGSATDQIFRDADAVLRDQWLPSNSSRPLVQVILVFGFINGAAMGSFGVLGGGHSGQMIYSGLKVPLLLLVTFGLCLPSFFVINSLMGLRADFGRALHSLLLTQASIAIILSALSPLTALWYASDEDYHRAILVNASVFFLASLIGQVVMRRSYQPLIALNRRHRPMMQLWLVLYALVGIQMGWVLRPFIGSPSDELHFFRQEAWSNAYLIVWRLVVQSLF